MLLLLFIPAGVVLTCFFIGYGLGSIGRVGVRAADRRMWLRTAGALLGAVAVALYTWGLLCVAGAVLDAEDGGTDSSPLRPCRTPGQSERALTVVDYSVAYVPLRFVCETDDGGSYTADSVPPHLNPAVLGAGLAAAGCALAAAWDQERHAGRRPSV
ncbi:hypothetical protein WN71_029500 [Streptomyces mangrovisoli]|uniref:Uncharacterized protein n=1 Tax=Streptomyces mangrovisoli TaxID=1428628 RepID=A0A1J4NT27_9ACTN|nr:hypothetical protein WN71_029500 [Streptomyces mangrovisoli]